MFDEEVAVTSARCREAGESLREWRAEIEQYELLPILEQIERITHGERGEKLVGAVLDELREEGYFPIHAVPLGRGDIDHVLVGPAGVFVIETKHPRSNGLITFRNGQGIFVDGRPKWNPAIKQAKNAAAKIGPIVEKHCAAREGQGVMPVVVFVGNWRVADQWESTDVRVFTPATFQNYIRDQQPVLTHDEIQQIASLLERAGNC
jgi:hypothetical protein